MTTQKTILQIMEDFSQGHECAEQVCTMLADRLGTNAAPLRRAAAALGSGMGCAETCGCVSAAMLVLGARYAVPDAEEATRMEGLVKLAEQREAFLQRFRAAHGGLSCKSLLGHDIFAPGGRAAAMQEGKFQSVCGPLVLETVTELEKLL